MDEIINIIHLPQNHVWSFGLHAMAAEEIRHQSYLEEMAAQRAKFIVWDGVIDKPNFKAISKAHKKIVKDARDKKLSHVTIMEDDCKFSHPDSFKYYLQNKPDVFDLYFGVIYEGEIGEDNRVLNGFSAGLTLYTVHSKFYDTFLKMNPEDHLDRALGEIAFNNLFYVCSPMVCFQMEGYSFHHKKQMQYGKYVEGIKLFSGL